MHRSGRSVALSCVLALASALPAAAQSSTIVADLVADVTDTEKKFLALANAIPADKWDWRPGAGVRSVGEVFKHVAADNYLIPAGLGYAADASTGIKGDDYKTAVAFEKRTASKAAAIAELEKSFAFVKKSLAATSGDKLAQPVSMFGMSLTSQKAWIMATTHLHEHLGQLIAYARSNGVAPPWSRAEP
jgi:uncharacterized damage-inducible protein DinB